MKRKYATFPVGNYQETKLKVLNFGDRFSTFSFLDNHGYSFDKTFDCLAAMGAADTISHDFGELNNFVRLDDFLANHKDWIFGHLSYDLKNEIEHLSSKLPDPIGFPHFTFFVPEIVIILSPGNIRVECLSADPHEIFQAILGYPPPLIQPGNFNTLSARITRHQYVEKFQKIKDHILRGDCYEINFCQEFFVTDISLSPIQVFAALNGISPNPFSGYYKSGTRHLCCASPERFLKKTANTLFSQPMKGTASRDLQNLKQDLIIKEVLCRSEKEKAENTMIVDLVRNDLSKVCGEGSVHVKDFQSVHTFPHVHQMISTVKGELSPGTCFSEILKATFPMGSMTGAPKKKVMELIEQYECTKRGLFSGSLGYFAPDGDFDFNVVIRSIQYNTLARYASILVGSAITAQSEVEAEYEECIFKIQALSMAISAGI